MLTPLPSSKWDYDAAGHLLVRAGFGGSIAEIQDLTDRGILEKLLNSVPAASIPPTWAYANSLRDLLDQIRSSTTPEEKVKARQAFNQANQGQMADLIQWWTQLMTDTNAPLLEKMTLFWHGHFATSATKVKPAYKMWLQNQTLRAHALGNFGTLTKAVSRDPAMLVWLDLASSQKERPNENFSRELMELFTLGEGNYTESDIKESAKAFTGYRINRIDQQFRFAANQFDSSIKVFMKKAGPWNGDQIINIILEQPQCARFVVTKLWRFFVYEDPDTSLVDELATKFRQAHYEIKPLLRTIFSSEEFYSDRAKGAIIKSPVQYLVQARRSLGVYAPEGRVLANIYRQLGQVPFYPPNVKGWDGGKSWNGVAAMPSNLDVGTPGPAATPFPPLTPRWPVEKYVNSEDRSDVQRLLRKLYTQIFQSRPQPDLLKNFVKVASNKTLPLDDGSIRDLVMLMMTTPNYQVS